MKFEKVSRFFHRSHTPVAQSPTSSQVDLPIDIVDFERPIRRPRAAFPIDDHGLSSSGATTAPGPRRSRTRTHAEISASGATTAPTQKCTWPFIALGSAAPATTP